MFRSSAFLSMHLFFLTLISTNQLFGVCVRNQQRYQEQPAWGGNGGWWGLHRSWYGDTDGPGYYGYYDSNRYNYPYEYPYQGRGSYVYPYSQYYYEEDNVPGAGLYINLR